MKRTVGCIAIVLIFAAGSLSANPGDVYVAGTRYDLGTVVKRNPCYWLNGKQNKLPITGAAGGVSDIVVSGRDVYIAGYECEINEDDMYRYGYLRGLESLYGVESSYIPCYWVNGKQNKLPITRTSGTTSAIAVSGRDVYVVGSEKRVFSKSSSDVWEAPCYWKNGEKYNLPSAAQWSVARDIVISGGDVHIVGLGHEGNFQYTLWYWVNGTWQELSYAGSSATIAVFGGDLYIAGGYVSSSVSDDGGACYWKNGIKYNLPIDNHNGGTTVAVVVSGEDVYILGYGTDSLGEGWIGETPYYWKNGVPYEMSGYGWVAGIAVEGR
jgi:hypothetical protein